jgi:transposase
MTAAANTSFESLQKEIGEQRAEILYLKEQISWLQKQLFGKKSERLVDTPSDQLLLSGFENLDQKPIEETTIVPAHKRKTRTSTGKDAIQLPEDLPVETIVIDISEKDKICKETGVSLEKIGEEVSCKLAYRPGSYFLKKIIRPKYAHPKKEENGITIASMPDSLLPKCRADESLLAEIVTRKFVDHLPLYRVAEGFSRDKILIGRRLLSQWVVGVGLALRPLYLEMKKRILEGERLHIDESHVDIFDSPKLAQGYMWVLVGGVGADPPYRFYAFKESRKHIHAEEILEAYSGIIHSDKYGAYETYIRKHGNVWCPCWAHIRRKFFEAEAGDPTLRTWILEQIQQLFALEAIAWTVSAEERLRIRQVQEIPLIDALIDRVKERLVRGAILPKSKFKEALCYFSSLVPHLKNYTRHSEARFDNNPAERAIRPLAIGRKNWLFVGSEESGESAATLLSLTQTCRALKIHPQIYLEDVFRRIMVHSQSKLSELLPDEWLKSRRSHTTFPSP